MDRVVFLFVTFFGIGKLPKMPGTWATLATIPIFWLLSTTTELIYMSVVMVLLILGIFACEYYERKTDSHDSSILVIDEVVGYLITMTWLPTTWQACVAGFLLFRVLDILKPFPIGYLDKKIPGGVGVMADDIAAGIVASIVLQILYNHTDWLGVQLGM